jgi:selenocysteine lyase/cysteine desulfurase
MKSYKSHFQKFISADPKRVHFAAHSHHFWPDVSFDAHMKAWTDAATLADDKWDRVFGKLWPRAQRHVARVLRLPDPTTIAFAPNVHDLVMRVVSCLPEKIRVLTTDGEFHSFSRQLRRFEETGRASVVRVPTRPFETFTERFREASTKEKFDLAYVSHVFFDSGFALRDLVRVVEKIPRDTTVIVDGYHAFCAIDVDLSSPLAASGGPTLADRIFYVAGGYKYAMSGEGCCFMHAPPGIFPRPVDTGWFAGFFAVTQSADATAGAKTTNEVSYAEDASRFLGATFDPTPLYRFDAVMSWLERDGITAREIDERAKTLQKKFIDELGANAALLGELVVPIESENPPVGRGQFLVFQSDRAKALHDLLASRNVMTDFRGDRLRFGFAIYHDESDVVEGAHRIADALI